MQGGLVVNTVASAAAAAARQTNALPFARLSDTTPTDDCSEEVVDGTPWRSALTSHVWAGSALLFSTASGEVWYLTPLGRARRVCVLESPVRRGGEGRVCRRISSPRHLLLLQRFSHAAPLLVAALPGHLVLAARHAAEGTTQVRRGQQAPPFLINPSGARHPHHPWSVQIVHRAFSPLEPLLCAALDHAVTRPKPALLAPPPSAAAPPPPAGALLGGNQSAHSSIGRSLPAVAKRGVVVVPSVVVRSEEDSAGYGAATHPVVAKLASCLEVSLAVYGQSRGEDAPGAAAASSKTTGKTHGVGGSAAAGQSGVPLRPVRVLHAADAATAIPALSLAALARDYAFVRDLVVRYAHANAGGGQSAAADIAPTVGASGSAAIAAGAGGAGAAAALRDSAGTEWGVTRTVVAALQASSLVATSRSHHAHCRPASVLPSLAAGARAGRPCILRRAGKEGPYRRAGL